MGGKGDCDYDVDCMAGLVCGDDNCVKFYPGSDVTMDCCVKDLGGITPTLPKPTTPPPISNCSPLNGNWDCCTEANKCSEGKGDCDYDVDCMAGLVCGDDNC